LRGNTASSAASRPKARFAVGGSGRVCGSPTRPSTWASVQDYGNFFHWLKNGPNSIIDDEPARRRVSAHHGPYGPDHDTGSHDCRGAWVSGRGRLDAGSLVSPWPQAPRGTIARRTIRSSPRRSARIGLTAATRQLAITGLEPAQPAAIESISPTAATEDRPARLTGPCRKRDSRIRLGAGPFHSRTNADCRGTRSTEQPDLL